MWITPALEQTMDNLLRAWAQMYSTKDGSHLYIDERSHKRLEKLKAMDWEFLLEEIPRESHLGYSPRFHTTTPTPANNMTWGFMDHIIDMAGELGRHGLVPVRQFYRKLRLFMRFLKEGPIIGFWLSLLSGRCN